MSSNTIVGLTSPINPNEAATIQYDDYKTVRSKEFFGTYENIVKRIERIGDLFIRLQYEKDKDQLY